MSRPKLVFSRPLQDITQVVGKWAQAMAGKAQALGHSPDHIEIEAKLGRIQSDHSSSFSEYIVPDTQQSRFSSEISQEQFGVLQAQLASRPVVIAHADTVDLIFNNHIRTTLVNGSPIETIQKIRLGDLNVCNPNYPLDWRVSSSLELPCQPPPQSTQPVMMRTKKRTSYTLTPLRIDLTVVTKEQNGQLSTTYEAEVEILPQAQKSIETIDLLVSTIQAMSRR